MVSVQNSRFALLKIEDDYDSDDKEAKAKKSANQTSTQLAKKKNKKKKADQAKAETEELRNLAFGKPVKKVSSATTHQQHKTSPPGQQWEEWKKVDEQFTDSHYEQQLQQALLQSKLQLEEVKQTAPGDRNENGTVSAATKEKKKKQKKGKATPMSLEQFNHAAIDKPRQPDSDEEVAEPWPEEVTVATSIPADRADPLYFNKVEDDVQKIIRKEQIHEQYKKQYAMDSAQSAQHRKELELKDKEISMLRTALKSQEDELKQVKKRNQQLCHILGQGEMKEKTAVLLELEELKQVRDELTLEVTQLTSDLEKERSKVHALKADIDKGKAGKHTGK